MTHHSSSQTASLQGIPGLVAKSTGSWYKVLPLNEGATPYDCRLRGNFRTHDNTQTNPIAVGDHVTLFLQPDGTGVITHVEDRRNCIIRKATKLSKREHILAANIDTLCIVVSLTEPRTSSGFIDRLLVTAEAYHIPAAIVINKVDLFDADLQQTAADLQERYSRIGYPVWCLSALQGYGLQPLRERAQGHTLLFAGHSGVGKSALINAMDPTLQLRVGAVSRWSQKGQHTTTSAQLYPFAGGYLIDTPGIKEFGLVDIQAGELALLFPEMRALLPQCHFANCTHRHEPHCAVTAALQAGTISPERYTNYLNMLSSIEDTSPAATRR